MSFTCAVEGGIAHTEGVEVTTVGITNSRITIRRTALVTSAHSLLGDSARMRSDGSRHGVGFPDIHLRAASTEVTSSRVGGGAGPALNVGLEVANAVVSDESTRRWRKRRESTYDTVDELEITRTLRVAISRTVLGTRLIRGVCRGTPISRHLREVEGTIETAG